MPVANLSCCTTSLYKKQADPRRLSDPYLVLVYRQSTCLVHVHLRLFCSEPSYDLRIIIGFQARAIDNHRALTSRQHTYITLSPLNTTPNRKYGKGRARCLYNHAYGVDRRKFGLSAACHGRVCHHIARLRRLLIKTKTTFEQRESSHHKSTSRSVLLQGMQFTSIWTVAC